MRILMVNKFLYPNGGSESYLFGVGKQLAAAGNQVSYFGMGDARNIVGNAQNAYTKNMNFRQAPKLEKLIYPFSIIYSRNARKQIAKVLDGFKPDVVHLNNINFQITPSILYEIKKRKLPIVWTAHDYQIICPNHMLYLPDQQKICERCTHAKTMNCLKNKCIHGSTLQSAIAVAEAKLYRFLHTYRKVDAVICPSHFMQEKLSVHPDIAPKLTTMHNYIMPIERKEVQPENYVLYFGRFDREKGIETLLKAAKKLPNVSFIFAGKGELESELEGLANVKNVGFQSGEALEMLIRKASVTVYPSEWYENCPFSVMESQMYQTPVVGANIGGIPELIQEGVTGLLFEPGNADDLTEKIKTIVFSPEISHQMRKNMSTISFDTLETYTAKLIQLYRKVI